MPVIARRGPFPRAAQVLEDVAEELERHSVEIEGLKRELRRAWAKVEELERRLGAR